VKYAPTKSSKNCLAYSVYNVAILFKVGPSGVRFL
jgi:hypothetical protein